jgi:UDP-glucose 4-epimerase
LLRSHRCITNGAELRYLVTGGAGFIGSHLAEALLDRGDSVVILDDLSTGRRDNVEHLLGSDRVQFIEGTILDGPLVDDLMRSVDGCFHLASAVGVQLIVEQPLDSLLRNLRGNDTVISAAARHRTRLLFTSTSEIYGKNSSRALSESSDRVLGSPFKSRWAYSTTKACGEILAHSYYREQGCPMTVARLFNTAGPRQSPAYGMVLPRFVRQALDGSDLTVYGDGMQTRCFIHVYDTVRAILMIFDSDLGIGGVYNVGAPSEISILELARLVIERTDSSSKIKLVPYDEAYEEGFEELGRRVPDTTALRQLTGWEPSRSLIDIVDDVIAYERTPGNRGAEACPTS